MAYNVNWKIEFRDIEERLYRIEILTNNYSGSPIPLRGAENPFETTEENDDDLFRPIRKQTGMLRIADTGKDLNGNDFNYSDLLPSQPLDHPVRLKYVPASGTEQIKWIGFLRSDTLTAKVFTAVDIREFQVVCPLGVLYDMPFTFTSETNSQNYGPSFQTMGQILYWAFNAIKIHYQNQDTHPFSWDYLVKSANANSNSDLTTRISLVNFATVEPTYSGQNSSIATWVDSKTWGEVLEDICRFWGWVMYSRCLFVSNANKNAVFLIAKGHTTSYTQIAFSNLRNDSISGNSYERPYITLEELSYKSTNHTEEFLLGKRYINILADVNEKEMVINPKMEDLPYEWHLNTSGNKIHVENWLEDNVSHYADYVLLKEIMPANSNSRTVTQGEFIIYTNIFIRTGEIAPFVVIMEDIWPVENEQDQDENKSSFNLQKAVLVYKGANPNNALNRCFQINTAQEVCLPAGSTLCINANCRKWYKPSDQDSDLKFSYLTLALKVGNEWWNGSYFTETQSTFTVDLDNKNKKIKNTKNLFDNNNGASGYCIDIAGTLHGRLELYVINYIYDDPSQSQDIGVMLEDLTVGIYNPNDMVQPQAKSAQQYKDMASQEFKDNLEVNLNMASGTGLKYGIGQLYKVGNSGIQILDYLYYTIGGTTQSLKPEENLLRRMIMAYGSSRHYMTIDVEISDINSDPTTYFNYETTQVGYSFLNAKRNWRDNKLTLTIVDFI